MIREERELLLISKGNELAFDAFMQHHTEQMYHHAYGILGNKENAEETVSDAFMEVWKNRGKLLEIDNVDSWLYTIIYHKAVSSLRKNKRLKHQLNFDELQDFNFPHTITPVDSIISKEEHTMLHAAIEQLPPKCKRIFYMAKIEQLPYAEICRMLEISLTTVNYHIGYAMNALKKRLKPHNTTYNTIVKKI